MIGLGKKEKNLKATEIKTKKQQWNCGGFYKQRNALRGLRFWRQIQIVNIMTDAQEKLGQAIDRVDSMAHGLNIPLPDDIHVSAFKSTLPEIVTELKLAFAELTGENPWG